MCVCVCVSRKITHSPHRVCDGTAIRRQRSENGHPGAMDQAGRAGRLTVSLKSLGELWSIESFPRSSTLLIRLLRTIISKLGPLLFSGRCTIRFSVEITRQSLSFRNVWIAGAHKCCSGKILKGHFTQIII